MEMKHTPGPWAHTNHVDEEGFADIESVNHLLYIRAQWGSMTRLPKGKKKSLQLEMEANARLIAAAPDLLAAVEAFLDYDSDPQDDGAAMMIAYADALRLAKDARAKALGAAP